MAQSKYVPRHRETLSKQLFDMKIVNEPKDLLLLRIDWITG